MNFGNCHNKPKVDVSALFRGTNNGGDAKTSSPVTSSFPESVASPPMRSNTLSTAVPPTHTQNPPGPPPHGPHPHAPPHQQHPQGYPQPFIPANMRNQGAGGGPPQTPLSHSGLLVASPRVPPPPLQAPGTPPAGVPTSLPSAGPRLNSNSSAFVPSGAQIQSQRPNRVVIKDASGHEVDLNGLRKQGATPSTTPSTPASDKNGRRATAIRMESEEARLKRIAEEREDCSVDTSAVGKRGASVDQDSQEIVERKVRALLNKLTLKNFESISNQVITWANKSETEKDGRTLIQAIRLVVESVVDDEARSEVYARLCRKMMEQISPQVQDDGIRNNEGKPITGGLLFRKYLLNRCQEDFERGWSQKESTAANALVKATEDQAIKGANDKNKEPCGESVLYSDEYYAARKVKRQGLGLIKFIGELFKLQILTERIMHGCIKKLLSNVDNPKEEEIESLCKLLTTVGQALDMSKARRYMDVYFNRMKELSRSSNVSPQLRFLLQDAIELRKRKWFQSPYAWMPPTLIVHEFFAIRDLDEGECYFSVFPPEEQHILVRKLIIYALKREQADARLVADLFKRAISRDLCSPASFEEGFTHAASLLDAITINAPKASSLMATMIKGVKLDIGQRMRIASNRWTVENCLRF